jgi:putative transposase
VYAYVFMLNHIHLIIKSKHAAGFFRDFKKYTTKKFIENIKKFEPEVSGLFKKGESGY